MSDPIVDLGEMEIVAQGIDHPEGICMTLEGVVFVSGEQGQIYRIEPDGTATEVATTRGWTLGLAADARGRVYACDPRHRAVFRWDPANGAPQVWTSGAPGDPFRAPNWGAFAPDGAFYVSDSGTWKARDGRIFVVRRGETRVWTDASVDFPNGLAVSPDGRELWVLESTPGRMVAFGIRGDGSPGPRRIVAELPGNVPDGLAFASDGSVVIACYRPDVVYRWSGSGGLETLAHDPEGTVLAAPTNCAFTGPDLDVIAVPNIGRWHVTRFRVPGLRGVPLSYPDDDLLEP